MSTTDTAPGFPRLGEPLCAKKLVAFRPFNIPPAEHRTHGPWQIAATSLPCRSISWTN